MAGEMDGKIAIVTGASRGIGLACVETLLAAGATVVGCSLDKDVTAPISTRYRHHTVDVTKPAELEDLIADTGKASGRLDILVNNAGTHPPTQAIDDFSVADFDALYHLNLRSVFVGCRAALPRDQLVHTIYWSEWKVPTSLNDTVAPVTRHSRGRGHDTSPR